ncbi:hypothetical protein ABB29_14795 [Pseudoxanthomonas dokdonensis]|uniref:Uncharacterized protein n=2 Tax=Pseudoxanthomonas dokdonensis TaxID=344882 RepID=A0A0R0CQ07_9GAMM|nr:hypothetical protein ABB29_14795 [Pseudoxanthomonas dokdonensis]
MPSKLPDCFHWVEDEAGRQRLFLHNIEVLEVRQQRGGWVVQVHLNDSQLPAPMVAVRSPAAGMRWGARWSKLRAPQLAALVAGRRHEPRQTCP